MIGAEAVPLNLGSGDGSPWQRQRTDPSCEFAATAEESPVADNQLAVAIDLKRNNWIRKAFAIEVQVEGCVQKSV